MNYFCRDYENIFPKSGNATVVEIKGSNEMGIYVSLLEYDNIEGLLLLSEISRRRIRSLTKLIKIGRKEIVSVIRVDDKKSYIDVSKRQMTEIEINYMKKKRNFGKIMNLISNNISRYLSLNFEENKLRWVWQLWRKFNHVIKAFIKISKYEIFKITSLDFSITQTKVLIGHLKKKMPAPNVKIELEVEILSFCPNGIQVLKESLIDNTQNPAFFSVNCKTLVSPRYLISINGESKRKSLKIISNFVKLISQKIISEKGRFQIINLKFF